MAEFCASCGSKLDAGARFCVRCGQPVSSTAAAPASGQPVSSNAAAPAIGGQASAAAVPGQGSSVVKILFAILGVILLFGILAAGSCFYIGYRVKKRANEISKSLTTTPYRGKKDACSLVTKAEVRDAFAEPVKSVESTGSSGCEYVLGRDGSKRLGIDVTWEGGRLAMKLSHGAMKAISGTETFTPIEGVGDEAYVAPMGSGLMMRKGDVMVNIDLRTAGLNADAAKKLAAKMASRLQ